MNIRKKYINQGLISWEGFVLEQVLRILNTNRYLLQYFESYECKLVCLPNLIKIGQKYNQNLRK